MFCGCCERTEILPPHWRHGLKMQVEMDGDGMESGSIFPPTLMCRQLDTRQRASGNSQVIDGRMSAVDAQWLRCGLGRQ